MRCDRSWNIDISHPIPVGEAEGLVSDVSSDPLEAPPCHGGVTRINDCHSPWFGMALMNLHGVFLHVESHIGHVEEVVGEVLLDDISLVSGADDEVPNPV